MLVGCTVFVGDAAVVADGCAACVDFTAASTVACVSGVGCAGEAHDATSNTVRNRKRFISDTSARMIVVLMPSPRQEQFNAF